MAAQGSHQTEKRLCVGLLAHVDAGKTTVSRPAEKPAENRLYGRSDAVFAVSRAVVPDRVL